MIKQKNKTKKKANRRNYTEREPYYNRRKYFDKKSLRGNSYILTLVCAWLGMSLNETKENKKKQYMIESAVSGWGWCALLRKSLFLQHRREKKTPFDASSFAAQPPASQLARVR